MYLTVYVIEVYTGDKAGAGTDAHVFVTLYGKRGQAPKTQLISRCGDKSIKSNNLTGKNTTNTTYVICMYSCIE